MGRSNDNRDKQDPIRMANSEWLVRTVLAALREGQIVDAVNECGGQFAFNHYGIGLGFRDKGRLTEFFRKTRELYPDSLLLADAILVSGDHVIRKWTQQYTATVALIPAGPLKVPISLHAPSVVQIENGEITRWSDYYDGLISRRTALASYFTDWIEL
jgi:hypothetical protein